jgi:hypothetical protein
MTKHNKRSCRSQFHPFWLLILLTITGCSDKATEPIPVVDIGRTWRQVESGIANSIQGLAFNDTIAVAVGDGGIIYSSSDRRDWVRQRPYGPNDGLTDVVWFNDRFVAVGLNGMNITSPDGVTWTTGTFLDGHLYALAVSVDLVTAVGNEGRIYTSTDGVDWTLAYQSTGLNLRDILHTAGGAWVAVGDRTVLRSSDGAYWQTQAQTFAGEEDIVAVAVNDTALFLIAADPIETNFNVYSSVNADNWFFQSNLDAWNLRDLTWTGSLLVAVGEGTYFQHGMADGLLFSSPDGITWTEHRTDAPFSLAAVDTVNGEVIAAGSNGYILSGTDPDHLTVRSSGANMTGVVWDGLRFVAVTAQGTVMFSSDGSAWTEYHSGVANGFERLAWSGSKYVTAGGLGVATDLYTSDDGVTWARTQAYDNAYLNDVVWAGGRFLACGQAGTVFLSETGDSWTRQFVGDSVPVNCIIHDGARYLAATTEAVYTSTDGITWTKPEVDSTSTAPNIRRMLWTGERYIAAGNDYSNPANPRGVASVSSDAVHWTVYDIGPADKLTDIVRAGSGYIISGRYGDLWNSTDGTTWIKIETGTEYDLTDIAVSGDRSLVVGGTRTVFVSP